MAPAHAHFLNAKKLQRKLIQARARATKVQTEITDTVAQLQGICDHPHTTDYVWEHDNGYGRQTQISGLRCRFCGWVDLWKRGKFTDPKDID